MSIIKDYANLGELVRHVFALLPQNSINSRYNVKCIYREVKRNEEVCE